MFGNRRRRRRGRSIFRYLEIDPRFQYVATILSALLFTGMVFSGFLVFRYSDQEDLLERGKQLMGEGKVAFAARTFQMLVNRYRESYEGHLLLGQAYLELDDRKRAEQEFQIASVLKARNPDKANSPDLAMVQLAIARGQFELAEESLKTAAKKNPNDPNVMETFCNLYEAWGDALAEDVTQGYVAIRKYEKALGFATNYRMEDGLKDKLVTMLQTYIDRSLEQGKEKTALVLLKKSLKYRYLPNTLSTIAELYEKQKDMDKAIAWYRKAFEANPSIISLKLSNILMARGRELSDKGDKQLASRYFEEAKKVSQLGNVPLETLYPVNARDVVISAAKFDRGSGEFVPQVKVTFENQSVQPLNFLMARATFYSDNDRLTETVAIVTEDNKPLGAKGGDSSYRNITFKPKDRIRVGDLHNGRLQAKIYIAYNEDSIKEWKLKAIQETTLRKPQEPKPVEPSSTVHATDAPAAPEAPVAEPPQEAPTPQ